MKRMHWLLVLFLVWTLPAWADDTRKQTFVVGADVNAQGEVTQTQVDADVTKPIAAVLDLALKHWSFVPAQREGKAVPVHTFIEAKLEALADASGKYTLTIRYVSQGPKWEHLDVPHYPEDAIRMRVEGSVEAVGELQADGRLIVGDSRTSIKAREGKLLVQAVDDYLRHDRYTPETVDGKPVPARLRTLVRFNVDQHLTPLPAHCKRSPGHIPVCGDVNGDSSNDAPPDPPEAADRDFLVQTGFDVGITADRSWHSGISSVLQPRIVNPIRMHL
jgi:hypothetical protein